MKKIKILTLFLMTLLLSGCYEAKINMTINKDGSGLFVTEVASIEDQESETEMTVGEIIGYQTQVEDIKYDKDGETYIGKRVTIKFENLDQLKDIYQQAVSQEDQIAELEIIENNNQITLKSIWNGYTAEDIAMINEMAIINLSISFDGNLISSNSKNQVQKTHNWNFTEMTSEGLNLTYSQSENISDKNEPETGEKSEFKIEQILVPAAIISGLFVLGIVGNIVKKKNN